MKDKILKIAGVKSETAFYKKFPTEEAFIKAHGKELKKAKLGDAIPKAQTGTYSFDPSLTKLKSFGGGTKPTLQGKINVGQGGAQGGASAAAGGAGKLGGYMDAAGGVIEGIGMLQEAGKAQDLAEQQSKVTDVQRRAAESTPKDRARHMYDMPWDNPVNPGELGSPQGQGTNYLSAEYGTSIGGNPTEIQNTFAPNDIYTDGGYEPLEDSEMVKQYRRGGNIKTAQTGFGGGGYSKIGSSLGGLLGPVGGIVGSVAGGIVDEIAGAKTRGFQDITNRNMSSIQGQLGGQQIHNQYNNVLEDGGLVQYEEGGYMNPNYNPQLITKFGDIDVTDMHNYASEGMDVLRSGGHIKNYRNPSERSLQTYDLGGELKTTWGGHAEPISQNPYLPGTGETVMFRGKSHEEGDGNGHTGIGVTYGKSSPDSYTDYAEYGTQEADADVEVERGEPATELNDENGEKSLVVYGNLKISKDAAKHIGDAKAMNMKYKNYINSKSKEEARQNKIIEKALEAIDSNEDDNTVMGKMNLTTNQAILDGANMKLKQIADIKIKASQYQNAVNDTAAEYGVDADALAKGKIKIDKQNNEMAKFGKNLKKEQYGVEKDASSYFTEYDKEDPFGLAAKLYDLQTSRPSDVKIPYDPNNINSPRNLKSVTVKSKKEKQAGPKSIASAEPTEKEEKKKKKLSIKDLMMAYNEILPYIRPSDQEELDPSQLYPELMAAGMNQQEPVQAQLFNPQLGGTYNISLQDQLNANQADFNALQRQTGYNPEAQSMLAAQKYSANSKVLGDQFKMNQANEADTYAKNRQALDQAKLTNMGILDKQYERQETAKSKTKQQAIEIAKSMVDKVAQNKLENRKLGIMENMYNYRFDDKGRAVNMNPLAMFNVDGSGDGATSELEAYEKAMDLVDDYKDKRKAARKTKTTSRNGSIVKAIKNL